MAISLCKVKMDDHGRESVNYAVSSRFPIACYQDDMDGFYVPWHWHEDFECILGWEGTVNVSVRGEQIALRRGEGLFINSGVLHNVDMEEQSPAVLRSIVFHPRLIGGTSDSVFWQNLVGPLLQDKAVAYWRFREDIPWQKQVMEAVLDCWQAVAEESDDHENYVRYRLSAAFRLMNENLPEGDPRQSRQDQTAAQRIKQMLAFIEDHYTEELTLGAIAEAAAISESACLRCFRQMLNTSPIQYIKQLRLEKASQLLLATNRKVGDIALECGFSDLSYFTRIFREEKGISPKVFRKSAQ